MKLYKISQSVNTGWYTYDSAIVAANDIEAARRTIPSPFYFYDKGFYYNYKNQEPHKEKTDPSWCNPKDVMVEEVGETLDGTPGVMLASYNAGFDESRYLDMRRLKVIIQHHPSNSAVTKATQTMFDLEQQLKDRGRSELRYHLINANRQHDIKKVQEYELKLRDYDGEVYEDWS